MRSQKPRKFEPTHWAVQWLSGMKPEIFPCLPYATDKDGIQWVWYRKSDRPQLDYRDPTTAIIADEPGDLDYTNFNNKLTGYQSIFDTKEQALDEIKRRANLRIAKITNDIQELLAKHSS